MPSTMLISFGWSKTTSQYLTYVNYICLWILIAIIKPVHILIYICTTLQSWYLSTSIRFGFLMFNHIPVIKWDHFEMSGKFSQFNYTIQVIINTLNVRWQEFYKYKYEHEQWSIVSSILYRSVLEKYGINYVHNHQKKNRGMHQKNRGI